MSPTEEQTTIDKNHKDLKSWQESRKREFLFAYFDMLLKSVDWRLKNELPLWKVVAFEKKERVAIAYFANGEKWIIHDFDDVILLNLWLVKINQNCYVNMLYAAQELGSVRVPAVGVKSGEKAKRSECILLRVEIKEKLLKVIDADKLHSLLQISRRMKSNYVVFRTEAHQQQLDESRLGDTFVKIKH